VKLLVDKPMIEKFRDLLRRCGPEVRLVNVFAAVCFVEGHPERMNQEMCLELLWTNLEHRYRFGVTFHEFQDVKVGNHVLFSATGHI